MESSNVLLTSTFSQGHAEPDAPLLAPPLPTAGLTSTGSEAQPATPALQPVTSTGSEAQPLAPPLQPPSSSAPPCHASPPDNTSVAAPGSKPAPPIYPVVIPPMLNSTSTTSPVLNFSSPLVDTLSALPSNEPSTSADGSLLYNGSCKTAPYPGMTTQCQQNTLLQSTSSLPSVLPVLKPLPLTAVASAPVPSGQTHGVASTVGHVPPSSSFVESVASVGSSVSSEVLSTSDPILTHPMNVPTTFTIPDSPAVNLPSISYAHSTFHGGVIQAPPEVSTPASLQPPVSVPSSNLPKDPASVPLPVNFETMSLQVSSSAAMPAVTASCGSAVPAAPHPPAVLPTAGDLATSGVPPTSALPVLEASRSTTTTSTTTTTTAAAAATTAAAAGTVSEAGRPRPTLCYTRILLGEISPLLAAMRRATPRWSQHQTDTSQDPLVVKLRELQVYITSLSTRPSTSSPPPPSLFLEPFLAVIRSDDTTGPVTKTALASVNRMLSYGLVSSSSPGAVAAVEDIATAVTHARFVGTDQGADEVVLWEILTVLKTLLLGPVGHLLTNESVCELLNSSFRICFETRLSELLRNCTEDALRQMVGLLFARLPQFADDPQVNNAAKRLKMKAGSSTSSEAVAGKTGKRSKTSKLLQRSHSPTPSPSQPVSPTGVLPAAADTNKVKSPSPDDVSKRPESPLPVTEGDKEASKELHSNNADAASIDSGITDPSMRDSSVDISNAHLTLANQGSLESLQSPVSESENSGLPSPAEDAPHGGAFPGEASATTPQGPPEQEALCPSSLAASPATGLHQQEVFINTQGVKFRPQDVEEGSAGTGGLVPYGMACVREVLRFLVSLTSPTNDQNTPTMIATALGLITVALEVGGEHVNKCPSLLCLVRDQLCRNLLLLLKPEVRPSILMASLRVCILIFEGLRTHVKFQLEMFMRKLTDIITSEAANLSYSHKELALETVVQLWRIPGLITELFVNFDCDLYSDNIFEDLTKILSKNAFPVQGLYSTNLLSLDALLTVIDTLDSHSLSQLKARAGIGSGSQTTKSRAPTPNVAVPYPAVVASPASGYLLGIGLLGGFSPVTPILQSFTTLQDDERLLREHLLALKEKKKLLATGTDQFNVKPEKGIQFLQDNGILGTTNQDIAVFMKENPKLDKKMIGEYLSKKKNVGILSAFVRSFEFAGLRIDQCLRTFLETFRLPGEAPLISIIIEHFSSHWHTSNNEPFGKEDAAFTLAYAVIMLNVDQHNRNAKKQNVPMTLNQFRNNVRGVNDGKDFDQDMLEEIYNAICSEEIIMPAEQVGLVKENYLWKMLLKRGATKEGKYMLANDDHSFDRDLFAICWGPTVASLSYVFDKSTDDSFIQKSLAGFKKCASISARYGMSDVFDNLVVSLCKFTGLTSTANGADTIAIEFGSNAKAQLAAKTLFRLVTIHGDILRDGWKNVVEVLLQLFRSRLLPQDLTQSPDLLEGCVSLYRPTNTAQPRVEPSLLSSLYSYIALGDGGSSSRGTTPEDEECRERAKKCVVECHIEKLIRESAFLRHDALSDMLKAIMTIGDGSCLVTRGGVSSAGAASDGGEGEALDEYGHALLLEIVVQIIIANKDRAVAVWSRVHDYILTLMMTSTSSNKPSTSSIASTSSTGSHITSSTATTGSKTGPSSNMGYSQHQLPPQHQHHQQSLAGAGGRSSPSLNSSSSSSDSSSAPPPSLSAESLWLLGRCVSALLRMAGVLVRRPDMSSVVLQSLKMLFMLNPHVLAGVALQLVAGVHELLTLTADHITHSEDWAVVFALLECAGAGARPPPGMVLQAPHHHNQQQQQQLHMRSLPDSEVGSSSGPDSGHCSEVGSGSEATADGRARQPGGAGSRAGGSGGSRATSPEGSATAPGGWIMVGHEGSEVGGPSSSSSLPSTGGPQPPPPTNQWDIVQRREFPPLGPHPSPEAVVRSVDTLSFLVRERHMTGTSLPLAVQAARTFVEATLHGGRAEMQHQQQLLRTRGIDGAKSPQRRRLGGRSRRGEEHHRGGGSSSGGSGGKKGGKGLGGGGGGGSAAGGGSAYDADESDSDDVPVTFQQLSEKLLDLLDTLHTSAGSVMARTEAGAADDTTAASSTTTSDATTAPVPCAATTTERAAAAGGEASIPTSAAPGTSVTAAESDALKASTMATAAAASAESSSAARDDAAPPVQQQAPQSSAGDGAQLDFSSGSVLWQEVLCPLLQGIARFCCDCRPRIRNLALTYLQRALLNHDLQTLDAHQWEACFNKVLFPLLSALLPATAGSPGGTIPSSAAPQPPTSGMGGTEESRLRAATLVQKVYLRHLTTLLTLPTFTALWLTILDYLDKFLNINTTDHLCDAVPEILKNMLLVMETTQVFHTAHGFTRLWSVTWDRVDSFLPGFRTELFKSHPPSKIHRVEASTEQVEGCQQQQQQSDVSQQPPQQQQQQQAGLMSEPSSPQHPIPGSAPVNTNPPLYGTLPPPSTGDGLFPPVGTAAPASSLGAGTGDQPYSPAALSPVSSPYSAAGSIPSYSSIGAYAAATATGGGSMSDDDSRLPHRQSSLGGTTLDAQGAARLSLSQECLPSYASNIILQPPLPPLPLVTPLPHTHPVTPLTPQELQILHQQQVMRQHPVAPAMDAASSTSDARPPPTDANATQAPVQQPLYPSSLEQLPHGLQQQQPVQEATEPPVACKVQQQLVPPEQYASTVAADHSTTTARDVAPCHTNGVENNMVSKAVLGGVSLPLTASHLFSPPTDADDPFSSLPQSGV